MLHAIIIMHVISIDIYQIIFRISFRQSDIYVLWMNIFTILRVRAQWNYIFLYIQLLLNSVKFKRIFKHSHCKNKFYLFLTSN